MLERKPVSTREKMVVMPRGEWGEQVERCRGRCLWACEEARSLFARVPFAFEEFQIDANVN